MNTELKLISTEEPFPNSDKISMHLKCKSTNVIHISLNLSEKIRVLNVLATIVIIKSQVSSVEINNLIKKMLHNMKSIKKNLIK